MERSGEEDGKGGGRERGGRGEEVVKEGGEGLWAWPCYSLRDVEVGAALSGAPLRDSGDSHGPEPLLALAGA